MLTVAKKKGDPTGFGAKLRTLRTAAELSQERLAELAGLKRLSVIRYETGAMEPAWSVIVRLAAALGVKPNDFLDT